VADIWFRDWEEIPESAEDAWETMVDRILNGGAMAVGDMSSPKKHTMEPNGVRWDAEVYVDGPENECGYTAISNVNIGDHVCIADGSFTRVIGKTYSSGRESGDSIFGGAWIWEGNMWKHPAVGGRISEGAPREVLAYNLITEAGEFAVFYKNLMVRMRDAFEVGLDGMAATYDFTLTTLNSSDNSPPITE
jgi:hypothetical protein